MENPGPSVLIVDDEAELTTALEERLRLRGFRAQGVTSGAAALQRLREERWDVVLVDVKMSGLGGLELVRTIRQANPVQPVVLLTGHGSERDADTGRAMGITDYLMKPVRIEDLVQVLLQAADAEGTRS